MAGLSEAKRRAMSVLMDQAPDEIIEAIETRFHRSDGGLAADVVALARQERLERSVLRHAFGPVLGFMAPRRDGVPAPLFSRFAPKKVWAEVARRRPELTENLTAMVQREAQLIAPAELADKLCAEAASAIRSVDPSCLKLRSEAEADDLAAYFDMAPIARSALVRLPEWLGRLDGEHLTTLRLAFKDADAVREDGRARLMEILMAHLPRAGEILRLIAGLTDQAGADFIDGTEMASFPARLLGHIELLAGRVQLGGPSLRGEEADQSVANLVALSDLIREFDVEFPGPAGGGWTQKLQTVRRRLTEVLEAAFNAAPKAVEAALPLGSTRLAGRMSRMAPDLKADPDSPAVHRARALLRVLAGARLAAAELGCEGARRSVAQAVAERVDAYAEEALLMLHDGGVGDPVRALELIEVAAEFLGLSRNEEAGALVRRRAAVAVASDNGKDAAAA